MAFDVVLEIKGTDDFDLAALNETLGTISTNPPWGLGQCPPGCTLRGQRRARQVRLYSPKRMSITIARVFSYMLFVWLGRLQPLLGTVKQAATWQGRIINWPNEQVYANANLTGPMQGTMTWHEPITENPQLNSVEEWEIWNFSPDAHPIHLHLVKFKVIGSPEYQLRFERRPG